MAVSGATRKIAGQFYNWGENSFNTKHPNSGMVCDSAADDKVAFDTLVNTTMQPAGGIVDVVGVVRIASNMSIPSNVKLNFIEGAYIAPDGGVTVSYNGSMTAGGMNKRFGGGGEIAFGAKVTNIYDAWFGGDIAKATRSVSASRQVVHVTQTVLTQQYNINNSCKIVFDVDVSSSVNALTLLNVAGTVGGSFTADGAYGEGATVIGLTSVAGLAPGAYLYTDNITEPVTGIHTYSHYIIKAIVGLQVTLNRGLDTPLDATVNAVTSYAPINVDVDGKNHLITLTADEPVFLAHTYCAHSKVKGFRFKMSGAYSIAGSNVRDVVSVFKSYDVDVDNVRYEGMQGGTEFAHLFVQYSTDVDITRVAIAGSRGVNRGIHFLNGTHCTISRARIHGMGRDGTFTGGAYGAIFTYGSVHVKVMKSTVKDALGGLSGIQDTYSSHVIWDSNIVGNCTGDAMYYAHSLTQITITNNQGEQNIPVSVTAFTPFLMIRSGDDVTVNGNTFKGKGGPIWFRQCRRFTCTDNRVYGDINTVGIKVGWAGGDTIACDDGDIHDNNVYVDATLAEKECIHIDPGHTRIRVHNNGCLFKTALGTGNMSGIVFYGDATCACRDNTIERISGGATINGVYVGGAGLVYDNRMTGCTITGPVSTGVRRNILGRYALNSGITANRPTGGQAGDAGFEYWDTTLGKPVFWNGAAWKDATGAAA